ncbi:hypothetical protein LOZ58_003468 [Ophidiomyces ophidiicola]|nr:hypothetical protein LOZ65_002882 [Ophidiomyces ophidiicola]KAI1938458.1 hypothetical protein LOZ66_003261 [Ophidiomyces ophidiicola]KAI1960982.1 hypothetical protein LOZ58_003468 [Ophidiomyces ophidiicola]
MAEKEKELKLQQEPTSEAVKDDDIPFGTRAMESAHCRALIPQAHPRKRGRHQQDLRRCLDLIDYTHWNDNDDDDDAPSVICNTYAIGKPRRPQR